MNLTTLSSIILFVSYSAKFISIYMPLSMTHFKWQMKLIEDLPIKLQVFLHLHHPDLTVHSNT